MLEVELLQLEKRSPRAPDRRGRRGGRAGREARAGDEGHPPGRHAGDGADGRGALSEAFRIAVADAELDDLRDRLRPHALARGRDGRRLVAGHPARLPAGALRLLGRRLRLARAEARLNALPAVPHRDRRTRHPLHPRALAARRTRCRWCITHGWPGSVVEFLKVIGPLTDPAAHGGDAADAFHVVCPSLPGLRLQRQAGRAPGWGVERIAAAWAELMARLGYDRYGAQGGDWGTSVTRQHRPAATRHVVGHPPDAAAGAAATRRRSTTSPSASAPRWRRSSSAGRGSGYRCEQSTRPQTIGYGLVDSPAALCAWPSRSSSSTRRRLRPAPRPSATARAGIRARRARRTGRPLARLAALRADRRPARGPSTRSTPTSAPAGRCSAC